MVVIVGQFDLRLSMQSVLITTNVRSSSLADGEVYSIQHYVIKLFDDLQQVGGFFQLACINIQTINWRRSERSNVRFDREFHLLCLFNSTTRFFLYYYFLIATGSTSLFEHSNLGTLRSLQRSRLVHGKRAVAVLDLNTWNKYTHMWTKYSKPSLQTGEIRSITVKRHSRIHDLRAILNVYCDLLMLIVSNKANNKITELRTIYQRESQNS